MINLTINELGSAHKVGLEIKNGISNFNTFTLVNRLDEIEDLETELTNIVSRLQQYRKYSLTKGFDFKE